MGGGGGGGLDKRTSWSDLVGVRQKQKLTKILVVSIKHVNLTNIMSLISEPEISLLLLSASSSAILAWYLSKLPELWKEQMYEGYQELHL